MTILAGISEAIPWDEILPYHEDSWDVKRSPVVEFDDNGRMSSPLTTVDMAMDIPNCSITIFPTKITKIWNKNTAKFYDDCRIAAPEIFF